MACLFITDKPFQKTGIASGFEILFGIKISAVLNG